MHHELSCFIDGKFKLGPKITSGRFFHLYSGTDIQTGQDVTIMLESVNTKIPWLLRESKLYTRLRGGWGIPNSQWFGVQGEYNALVTDPLGTSLEDLFNRCNRKFTLKTVLMLVYFLISRVEAMHLKGYVHRDIGPANFFIRNKQHSQNRKVLVIIFFPSTNSSQILGRLCSIFHTFDLFNLAEQSRRDDLESLGYMLVYFLKGSLPWQKYESMRIWHRDEKIADKKMSTPVQVLCQSLPQEFAAYFFYCRSLRFDEKPDYAYLRRRFSDAFRREAIWFDKIPDKTVGNQDFCLL
ncbi:hypothetical protein MKW94_000203 [Papaver nudicaule]|uniref:Protein kinase domain-containing protein n=1 Tax=Papaver nudicaule TaxID=74823 RepID=A0AA41SK56_PAPNU|nr:hypothetical protein [Papaver nudicaule]